MSENKTATTTPPALDLAAYEKMVSDHLASLGLDPEKCRHRPRRLWSAYRGSALIYTEIFQIDNVNYLEVSCPIVTMPSKNLLPFYRRLLELNWKYMGVKFYIRDDSVYIGDNRELRGIDAGELKEMTNRVSYYADVLDEELIAEFKDRS